MQINHDVVIEHYKAIGWFILRPAQEGK